MSRFEAELWNERAWARAEKAQVSTKTRDARLNRELQSIAALGILVDWCYCRGISIAFHKRAGAVLFPDEKRIELSSYLLPEKQLHLLLHECGHHLIGDKKQHERFGMGYSQDDPSVKRTFHHKCDVVDEEFDAWHRGFRLGKRLKLNVDKSRYDKTRVFAIKTYMKWALKVGGYGGDDPVDEPKALAR